uniref:Lysophosphatidic acid receptor 5b n=1 Tax=Cyprinus carpio TaxID=7962 RepID=A0A8C1UJ60_CYPCA
MNMSVNFTNSSVPLDNSGPSGRHVASAVVYGLVLAVGLPLNALSLWILLRNHGFRSSCAVLMVNLAVSDLLLALSLPLRVYFYATLQWPFGAATCTAAIVMFRVNIRTSSIFITLISVDRMIALVFPLRSRYLRTSACAFKCCSVVWILISILCIPEINRLYSSMKHSTLCFENQTQPESSVISILQAIFFLILLLVNIVSTVVVIIVLKKRPSTGAAKVNNKMNVILIFVVNMLVFIIFFLPFTLQLLRYNNDKKIRALVCLASVNCCLDPLIYYFSLDSFWQDKGKRQTDVGTHSLSRSLERF